MTTKTEQLRAALIARGFVKFEHRSTRDCLKGKRPNGSDMYVWLNLNGGARWSDNPKKVTSIALSAASVKMVIAGKESKVVGGDLPQSTVEKETK